MDAVAYTYLAQGRILVMSSSSSVIKLPIYTLIILQLMRGCAIKTHFSNVN